MKDRGKKRDCAAEEVAIVKPFLSASSPVDVASVDQAELERIMQAVAKGDLSPEQLETIQAHHGRATSKRKQAIIAGETASASSASATEQVILSLYLPLLDAGVRSLARLKKAGKKTGKKARACGVETEKQVHRAANKLLDNNSPKRAIVKIISLTSGLSESQVRYHLKSHPKWPIGKKKSVS
jgi:hypothetical protein